LRRVVVFNYNSRFSEDIARVVQSYNSLFPEKALALDMYSFSIFPRESLAGPADIIIHSGGDGIPIEEDVKDVPKFYICYSHEWKAQKEGGRVIRLKGLVKGIREIEILKDDEILGKKGKTPIMKYHELAVIKPPPQAEVLAVSKALALDGDATEVVEALRYPDGSIGIQGHPEEGTAAHLIHNFLNTKTPKNRESAKFDVLRDFSDLAIRR